MRISVIFALLLLCVAVKGWVALLQPIGLALGAAFAALNLDTDLISDFSISNKNWFSMDKDNYTRIKEKLEG